MAPHSHKQQRTPRPHPSNRGKECPGRQRYLSGRRILPKPITGKEKASQLLDGAFLAYNAARLREGCELLVQRILQPDVTVAMSLAGALTPAGLGCSCIVPLIKAGFVDWIVSTGANLYHDLHFAFNLPLHAGRHFFDDTDLRRNDLVRIYDVLLGHSDCLLATDEALRQILMHEEFQQTMGTARLHHLIGKYAAQAERASGLKDVSVLAAAYRCGVPIYTSSPGDSAIGMIIAGMALEGYQLRIDPVIDVNETASIVLAAKRNGGKSAVLLIGGGSPKNFVLQTEPHIQEILRLEDTGHDYFFQVTDARPDTGGLSGATPSEAVSWGKVDPSRLPDAVVCYADSTIALPLITHYVLANHKPRPLRRLYDQRSEMLEATARTVANREV